MGGGFYGERVRRRRITPVCGRFSLTAPVLEVASSFAIPPGRIPPGLLAQPRYNIAPTQPILVARLGTDGARELAELQWGFVPAWSESSAPATAPINARAERVADAPMFRTAFEQRRCLVPACGFYEWGRDPDGRKTPYRFSRAAGGLLAFAGVWERWQARPDALGGPRAVESACIVTVPANAQVRFAHDRSPAVIAPADQAAWLGGDAATAQALLRAAPDDLFATSVASRRLGSPRHDDPGLLLGWDDLADLPLFE